jgi:hypothetical protein
MTSDPTVNSASTENNPVRGCISIEKHVPLPPLGAGCILRRMYKKKLQLCTGLQSRKDVLCALSLGVTERAKRELCFYVRRRLEPAPSEGGGRYSGLPRRYAPTNDEVSRP